MPGLIASTRTAVVRTAIRWWVPTPPRSVAGPGKHVGGRPIVGRAGAR